MEDLRHTFSKWWESTWDSFDLRLVQFLSFWIVGQPDYCWVKPTGFEYLRICSFSSSKEALLISVWLTCPLKPKNLEFLWTPISCHH